MKKILETVCTFISFYIAGQMIDYAFSFSYGNTFWWVSTVLLGLFFVINLSPESSPNHFKIAANNIADQCKSDLKEFSKNPSYNKRIMKAMKEIMPGVDINIEIINRHHHLINKSLACKCSQDETVNSQKNLIKLETTIKNLKKTINGLQKSGQDHLVKIKSDEIYNCSQNESMVEKFQNVDTSKKETTIEKLKKKIDSLQKTGEGEKEYFLEKIKSDEKKLENFGNEIKNLRKLNRESQDKIVEQSDYINKLKEENDQLKKLSVEKERELQKVNRNTEKLYQLLDCKMEKEQEKLEQEKERKICTVCLERERMEVILPCKHLCICHECSKRVKICPICRKYKRKTMAIYIP